MTLRNRTAIVVGDSCAAGTGASHKFGWAQQLEQHFYRTSQNVLGKDCFYNLAVPGEIAQTALEAIHRNEVERRHRFPSLSLLSLGGQQVIEDYRQTGQPQIEHFGELMGQLASKLYSYGNVLYVGVVAPNTRRLKNISQIFKEVPVEKIEETLQAYERTAIKAVEDACPPDRAVLSVPLFEATYSAFVMDALRNTAISKGVDAYTTAGDGTHPDDLGHAFIFRRVVGAFDDMMDKTSPLD